MIPAIALVCLTALVITCLLLAFKGEPEAFREFMGYFLLGLFVLLVSGILTIEVPK